MRKSLLKLNTHLRPTIIMVELASFICIVQFIPCACVACVGRGTSSSTIYNFTPKWFSLIAKNLIGSMCDADTEYPLKRSPYITFNISVAKGHMWYGWMYTVVVRYMHACIAIFV